MATSVISISLDSSVDSMGTPAGRVILFGTILTTIPDTTPMITPPTADTPIITPTIPPSPDHTSSSLDDLPASEAEFDPSEDPTLGHIPPLPATSPFLSSDDDTTDSDTLDTPPSPTHDTPFTKITASTQKSPVIPHRQVMILSHGQPILHGPSHKRRMSPMTSVPALPLVSRALSLVRAVLIPSPKRVRDIGYLADTTEGIQREQGRRIVGVESTFITLTERVAELEKDNQRLRGTASVES
nr:hypothetical protein [Tanacetum cinerariifolium]